MKNNLLNLTLTALTAVVALTTASAVFAADSNGCEPVYQAMLKQAQTPNHQYIQRTGVGAPNPPATNEYIVTANAGYLQIKGQWRRSPMSPQDNVARLKEAWAQKKVLSCKPLREETVDGEAAVVYAGHDEGDFGKSDSQIWISKRRGLPLKLLVDQWVNDGPKPDSHIATRIVYEDVKPPPGVQ